MDHTYWVPINQPKNLVNRQGYKRILAYVTPIAFAAIFAVIVLWWIRARSDVIESACIHNLKCIDGAKHQWALQDTEKDSNATPTWTDLAPFLDGGPPFCAVEPSGRQWGFRLPKYPASASYTIGRMVDSPRCTYSGRTIALYGLKVHVGDASIDSEDGEVFETYDLPGSNPAKPKQDLRIVGSIVGAAVDVLDETGHWTKVETGQDGTASLDTFSNKPVAIVVSKEGFITSSNFVRDPYRYDYNILLKRK